MFAIAFCSAFSGSTILRTPTDRVKCGEPFEVTIASETTGPFALSLFDPSTHLRWITSHPHPANTATHFTIPCHFLSDTPWLLIAERENETSATAKVRLFESISDPRILRPSPNSVFHHSTFDSTPINIHLSMPARLLGSSPHSLLVRVIISSTDSDEVLFDDSISLLNSSRIDYAGPLCERCTLSIVPAWDPSLRLSQAISFRDIDPEWDLNTGPVWPTPSPPPPPPPYVPTATTPAPDPNKSPVVMAVGVGFLIIGPACIGLFFFVNRRREEGDPSALIAGSLGGG